jgi:hypothetical protein
MKELPAFPHERLYMLANHMEATANAIASLGPLMQYGSAGGELAESVATGHAALVDSYLGAREEFESLRAQFEHDFMTWHVDTLAGTDANYRLGAPNQAPAQAAPPVPGYVPPKWAEDDETTLAAAKAAEDALSTGV